MGSLKKRIISLIIVAIIFILPLDFTYINVKASDVNGILRTVYCSTAKEIQDAMKNAKPGDRIVIKEGSYIGAWTTGGYYYSGASGTEENPIIIESENPSKPSELVGLRSSSGYVLYLVGSYFRVNNLKITNGQKGIMIDKGNNNIIDGCEVYAVENEGVHFRDGSSSNIIMNSKIYDTGTTRPDFGEGIYVGSDKGKWAEYKKETDNNIIRNCIIGPNVRAESVDIKEGSTGTIVENSIFYGQGIAGKNYADSFIDVKGNNAIIRNNIGYRQGNNIILDAFQIHEQVVGWGIDNEFYDNEMYLEDSLGYLLDTTKGTAKVYNNVRYPEGNMYKGNYKELEYLIEDVNRDRVVNIIDLSMVAEGYNKGKNDLEYKNILDINKDDIIDLYDLIRVSTKFM